MTAPVQRAIGVTLALAWAGAMALIIVAVVSGCGPSAREKTISTALATTEAARTAFVAYDGPHELKLVADAKDKASAEAGLAKWRDEQAKVEKLLDAAYRAVAIAATLNDKQSLDALVQAGLTLAAELQSLGVIP